MTEAKLEKSRRLYSQLEALDWKKYLEVPEELSEKGIRGVDLRMSYARNGYLDSWRYTIDHAFERDTKEYGVEKLRIGHYKLYFSNLHNCFSITVQRRQTDGKEIEMSLWVGKRSEELVICEPCNVLSDTERQAFFEPDDFDYICEFVEAISEVAPKIREYVLDGCKKKLG